MKTPNLTSLVGDLNTIVEASKGKKYIPESAPPLPPSRGSKTPKSREKAPSNEDWSWYTSLSRIGAMQLLGAHVPGSFTYSEALEPPPVQGTGLTEDDNRIFRAMAGIVLVEDKAPSREELEAVAYLAIVGELADTNLADLIGIDEGTAIAFVERFSTEMLDENAVTQAAVEARRRGTGRAVMETSFDPEARKVALESAEYILQALAEMQQGSGSGKSMGTGPSGRKALARAWTPPKGTEAKRPAKKQDRKSIKTALANFIRSRS